MPRYSTTTSIYTMLPGIASTGPRDALITQNANRVGGIIDSYVGRWYKISNWTTTATTPPVIQEISDALTAEKTMRSLYTKDGANKNEWVEEQAKQAWSTLKAISKQELMVFDSDGSESERQPSGAFIQSTHGDYTPIFDVDTDTAWKVDSDREDDISDARM